MKVRLFRKNRKRGEVPGTLEAPKGALAPRMQVFAYDADNIEEKEDAALEDIAALRSRWPMLWVNIHGLGDPALISALGTQFNLHPLALEDVMHTPQRPKVDEYDTNVLVIARMVEKDGATATLEQLSLFWGEGFVLTFQERPGDVFGPVRERLRKGGKRIKMSHPDYMAYALLDAVIDGYFPVLEHYGDKLDDMEQMLLSDPSQDSIKEIHATKRDLNILRLCLWPMRDAISKLRTGTEFVRDETLLYLRDCQDHIIQILDIIESYRERVSALNDLYLSSVNYRLNEVMKVLTIIATIFIPLNFVVGIYGMNFVDMPELHSPYGYPAVMVFMFMLAFAMMLYFWRAGWMSGSNVMKGK